ncbi:MAG: PH domain-containing protein [Melioribacteraceae bacterium]|nr:PH domain-containing protein [Melioribacteraceae bacterium]
MSEDHKTIYEAKFHPILKTYLLVYTAFILLISVAGIVIIPFWLLGLGAYYCGRYFESLKCNVTTKTLEIKKGWFFRVEKTIPLDKIQDLTLKEGPLLRALKLHQIEIETAGQNVQQGSSDAKLIGIVNPREFRKFVIKQRDALIEHSSGNFLEDQGVPNNKLLVQIRDSLKNIENLLNKNKSV